MFVMKNEDLVVQLNYKFFGNGWLFGPKLFVKFYTSHL